MTKYFLPAVLLLVFAAGASAQRPTLAAGARAFVSVDTTIVALTHARIIDGTGAAPRDNQTLIIRDGSICRPRRRRQAVAN